MTFYRIVFAAGLLTGAGIGAAACSDGPGESPQARNMGTVTSTAVDTSTTTVSPVCGDAARDEGEICDDGNTSNLDGCDATCGFEQVVRFNALQLMFARDSLCTENAIGGAIGSVAQSQLQASVTAAVTDGSISTLCQFRDLESLLGADESVTIGCVTGTPSRSTSYNGALSNDLDWWYTAGASGVDADNIPLARLDGTLHDGTLTAGPGNMALSMNLGGGSSELALSSVIVRAEVGTPRVMRFNKTIPRGHREQEHLDEATESFSTLRAGKLCGNISAASLATLPVPEMIRKGGQNECWEGYTAANSMLDVLVGGCSIFWVSPIAATQPDQADPGVDKAGEGAPYRLAASADNIVDTCYDARGDEVSLRECLRSAAYSIGASFTAQRVMIVGVQ